MDYRVIHYDQIDSTNIEAERRARKGEEQGLIIVAESQSAGKGRRGRSWESPAGENLYFSVLLKPEMNPEKTPMLTLVMAYSVAKVFREEGIPVQIKWPNDLVIAKKKVCGILTEMHIQESKTSDVVIGVGINVNTKGFPEELREKATSIYMEMGDEMLREELLQKILLEFQCQYEDFLIVQDLSEIEESYNNILINKNQEVLVLEPRGEYKATALGINAVGELLVKRENGNIESVYAGEVSVRGVYGYV